MFSFWRCYSCPASHQEPVATCIRKRSALVTLGFERFAQGRESHFDMCAIMRGFDGALGQFGNPLHLFTKRLPVTRAAGQAGDVIKSAKYARHDRDIACRASANLVE
jgi:hypothetical protein